MIHRAFASSHICRPCRLSSQSSGITRDCDFRKLRVYKWHHRCDLIAPESSPAAPNRLGEAADRSHGSNTLSTHARTIVQKQLLELPAIPSAQHTTPIRTTGSASPMPTTPPQATSMQGNIANHRHGSDVNGLSPYHQVQVLAKSVTVSPVFARTPHPCRRLTASHKNPQHIRSYNVADAASTSKTRESAFNRPQILPCVSCFARYFEPSSTPSLHLSFPRAIILHGIVQARNFLLRPSGPLAGPDL